MCLLLWVGGDAKQRFLDAVYWGNEQSLGTLGCSLPKVGGLLLCRRCNAMKPNNAIALQYTQPNVHFPLPLPQQLQCNETLCIAVDPMQSAQHIAIAPKSANPKSRSIAGPPTQSLFG